MKIVIHSATLRGPSVLAGRPTWITGGEIIWADKWTPEQIAAGRRHKEERRRAYYDYLDRKRNTTMQKLWRWLKGQFKR